MDDQRIDHKLAILTIADINRNTSDIKEAIRECFPNVACCDGVLMVRIDDYNKLVDLINEVSNES